MEFTKIWRSGNYTTQKYQGRNEHRHVSNKNLNYKGERKFKLTPTKQKEYISRCLTMSDRKVNKRLATQILTYPYTENIENPYEDLNKYLTNLKKNYNLNAYMSALEITELNQWHFHLLVDMPFTQVEKLNKAWYTSRGYPSKNAVRDVRYVRNDFGVYKYCFGYLSKMKSKDHDLQKFTCSNNVKGDEFLYIKSTKMYEKRNKKVLELISTYNNDYVYGGKFRVTSGLKDMFTDKIDVSYVEFQ
jgi:hypothetical protein